MSRVLYAAELKARSKVNEKECHCNSKRKGAAGKTKGTFLYSPLPISGLTNNSDIPTLRIPSHRQILECNLSAN